MNKYLFETDLAGFYEGGVDLLRNKFVYKKINYEEIKKIKFSKGHEIKNWFIAILFGLTLILGSIYIISPYVIEYLKVGDLSVFLFWGSSKSFGALVVLFLFSFGAYSVIIAFRLSLILKIYTADKKIYISLKRIEKEDQVAEFVSFIKENVECDILFSYRY